MDLCCVFFIVRLHFVLSNYFVFKKYRALANKKCCLKEETQNDSLKYVKISSW